MTYAEKPPFLIEAVDPNDAEVAQQLQEAVTRRYQEFLQSEPGRKWTEYTSDILNGFYCHGIPLPADRHEVFERYANEWIEELKASVE